MQHLLNDDGTVNLAAAERAQRVAETNTAKAVRAMRAAEREYAAIKPWLIESGRAYKRLEIARSNFEGCVEAEQRARVAVFEALNPELA